jgi:uncharacterized metal-binding protein YceD (DUF177 family)
MDFENRLLIRIGKKWDENDPDLLTIASDEHEIDISQNLYEYIHLALPLKRIHPTDKSGNSTCNREIMKKLDEHTSNTEKENDPRWDELKKLMNN